MARKQVGEHRVRRNNALALRRDWYRRRLVKSLSRLIGANLGAALLASCSSGSGSSSFEPISVAPPPTITKRASVSNTYAAGVRVAPDFRDLGHAPPSLQISLTVMLRYRHQNDLDALVQAQADRSSPSFRHYLTNAQFNAYFAPSIQAYRRVIGVLRAAGLRVVQTFGNRTIVEVSGPSDAVERLFATQIDYGVQAGHGNRYKNVSDAVMPPALRGIAAAVSGLNDLVSFAPRLQIVDGIAATPQLQRTHLRGPNGALGPLGFSRAYDEPNQHGYDGKGRAIANTFPGDINDGDLKVFLNYFGIKPAHALRRIKVDGGRLGTGELETTLDIETMIATAPGAQVYLYSFRGFTEAYAVDVYNKVVDDNLVDAVNSSWGGCEYFKKKRLGHFYAIAANLIFEQGAAKGITFPIATGDSGWTTCMHDRTIDETTADDATHALAVGGTTLRVDGNGNWLSETAWRGSAGGVSLVFPLPKYQLDVGNIVGAGRNIPDLSFDANPHTGFAERWHHIWVGAGGTSLGSPLWVGLEAQMDQYIGGRIGFVNPQLYALEQGPSYGTVFHDIVKGTNGGYRALQGFDLVTGIGTPIGWPLAQALK
jgi:subtilase family serine protease